MLWLVVALLIYIFQIFTIVLLEYKHPSKAVAWLLILFIFPLIGFVMYYFLAQEYTARLRVRKRRLGASREADPFHRDPDGEPSGRAEQSGNA